MASTTVRPKSDGTLTALADVAARAVREHGWDVVSRAVQADLAAARGGRAGAPSAELAGVHALVGSLSRSAWLPVVAPAVAALAGGIRHPQVDKRGRADYPLDRSLEIPLAEAPGGPMTRARQRRLLAVLGSAQVAGLVAAAADAPPVRQAFSVGMMAPGGGFLYTRDPALFAASMVAFAFSLLLWFGAGSMVAPPLVWVLAAAVAASRARGGRRTWRGAGLLLGAAVAITAAEQYRLRRRTFVAQVEQAKAANGLLEAATPPLRGEARPAPFVADELGDDELALTRRFVDMAMQEPDDWSNFTVIDQFQPAALRYQVDAMINSLALQRFVHAPAASTYLDEAQLRLIERYRQRKVWGYWALENLWGNLEWDPDPAKKQNIMVTGYYALSVGLYQTVSGDLRHSEPGALTFRWNNRREYRYSLGEIVGNLTADYVRSPWGLVVCEPNWIFSLCNVRGGSALRVHDRVHGTTFWDQVKDGYVRGFEDEIVRPDGMINGHRSSRLGLGQVGVNLSTDLRPLIPHVADRNSVLLQAVCRSADGQVVTPLRDDDRLLDPGNYTFHPLTAYAGVMEEAREVGDEDLFRGAYAELQNRAPSRIDERGWLTHDGASILAYTGLARALFGRQGGWLDLIDRGMPEAWRTGPRISSVPYPHVMVARAVSDGRDLQVVLRSTAQHHRAEVELDQLAPNARYELRGATETDVVADSQGRARIQVEVTGRQELSVVPRG